MEYNSFKRELELGKILPAYLFTGEEDFLIERSVQSLIGKLLTPEERTLNLETFYGRDAVGLPEALNSLPVFAARRVTLVRQAQELDQMNLRIVLKYLEAPPDDGCFILWAGKFEKSKSFYREIVTKIEPVECKKQKYHQLTGWIKDHVRQWGKTLDREAVDRLMAINWPSMRELAGELERLTLLIGDKEVISVNDVEELGSGSFAFERWALTDAVGTGNVRASQKAAENLLLWHKKPMQIINDLHQHFQRMWLIQWYTKKGRIKLLHKNNKSEKEKREVNEMQQKIGLHHPFVLKKYVGYAQQISHKALEDGILRVLEADANIKRGIRQPVIEVNMLVLDLVRKASGGG